MRFTFLLGVLLATSWLLAAAPVQAEGGEVDLSLDGVTEVGGSLKVTATVTSTETAAPIPGAQVTLTTLAEFGGERGFVVLARSVTDSEGVAVLRFEPRVAGEYELRAEIVIPGETKPLIKSATVTVAQSDDQLFSSQSGTGIFRSEWIVIGVVTTIWLVLFLIALGITDIARAGDSLDNGDNGEEARA